MLDVIAHDPLLEKFMKSSKPVNRAKKLLEEFNDNIAFEVFSLSKYQTNLISSDNKTIFLNQNIPNEFNDQSLTNTFKPDIQISRKGGQAKI